MAKYLSENCKGAWNTQLHSVHICFFYVLRFSKRLNESNAMGTFRDVEDWF